MTSDELIDLWRTKHKIDEKQVPTLLELMDLCESARIDGLESAAESIWKMRGEQMPFASNNEYAAGRDVGFECCEVLVRKMKGTV